MNSLKNLIFLSISTLGFVAFTSSNRAYDKTATTSLMDSSANYLDGTYHGQSRASYTSEPYWGQVYISVNDGFFTTINFAIRDSNLHEAVDSMYGVIHYAGNPEYMQQCVNDGHGIEIYPQRLLELQNIDNIDAITGATWSYNIFIAATEDALKDALKPTAILNREAVDKIEIHVQPNPFSVSLSLEYFLTEEDDIELNIYDNQGRLVKQLVNNKQTKGFYSVSWSDSSPIGVYYYRLGSSDITISSKIIKY
jgi:major membrane immunogen (membrane-anchored lipoprotein)